jgi:hypothetical protein
MKYLTVCTGALLALALAVSATPASADGYKGGHGYKSGSYRSDCYKCPRARPNYDSTEVIKDGKEVDHSRVIETQSVVPSKRLIETNHLVVHENETRHIGTVQHNHTIIEKELVLTKRNVDHKYVNTEVNLVEHKYNTERKRVVEERELPGEVRHLRCECPRDKAYPLRSYGMAPKYVSSRY